LQRGRKSTQRERLVLGMIAAANREGYAGASVSEVIAEARVSRPTFYDYFSDRDDCFLATLSDCHGLAVGQVSQALAVSPPERAARSAVTALVSYAAEQPAHARFLMGEAMAGGPRALEVRDEGIEKLASMIQAAESHGASALATPDLPLWLILGATYRLLASRLRRGVPGLGALSGDLSEWLMAYETPASSHRWRSMTSRSTGTPSPYVPGERMHAPGPLAPGRPRVSEQEILENHRQRLFFAAARLAAERGYSATTVGDITARAGLDRRAFYSLYRTKQHAFSAVHEFGFQQLLALTAGAFFAGDSWPERVWEGVRGLTRFLELNATFAHVGFVEAFAVGPGTVQRSEDSIGAFTIFLREGYQFQPRARTPSRVELEAIVTAVFECLYRETRQSSAPEMGALLAPLAFIALAPFLGEAAANAFIDSQLRAQTPGKAKARSRRVRSSS
jgi:TetR/AcrR family transcriptional regulator